MIWLLITAIGLPLVLSPLLILLERRVPSKLGLISSLFYAASFFCLYFFWHGLKGSSPEIYELPWVPSLNINLSFLVDGLSLYFGFLISGVGFLVNIYANYYMEPEKGSLARFYCYLNFFAASMLGAVFSNNLILMYLFWEMTGIASFFLIGYEHKESHAVSISRAILLLMALTGLFLLLGIILSGFFFQSLNWSDISLMKVEDNLLFSGVIFFFFLIGIMGKSAQVPFHFWLPKAMVAPTPVSAYLHAATMVKLGVYLTARLFPVFVEHPAWFPALTTISFGTMLIGAIFSLLSNEMKAILAYATVSQLGFFIGLYGKASEAGVIYDFVHILNHALYKGSLFMLAGIIAHATGIRDIRYLGGLRDKIPFTMLIFGIATAAMIGIPGTIGFVSKELILGDVVMLGDNTSVGGVILFVLILALIFKVAFSLRFFYHIFFYKNEKHIEVLHPPGILIQMPALVLSSLALLFGLWPVGLENLAKSFSVAGLHQPEIKGLVLWHGLTIELGLSAGIIVFGALLFWFAEKAQFWKATSYMIDFSRLWMNALGAIEKGASAITQNWLTPSPKQNLSILFTALVLFGLPAALYSLGNSLGSLPWLKDPVRTAAAFFLSIATLCIPILRNWIAKLIALSISGFMVALFFVLYKGPDLAMTQLLVEVASIFIILALFWGLLKNKESVSATEPVDLPDIFLSAGAGLTVGLLALSFSYQAAGDNLKDFFIQTSFDLDRMSNVVNLILVDFRGFDTLGEATVLVIAAIGVVRIMSFSSLYGTGTIQLLPSNILASTLPLIFFVVNALAAYFLIRGHTSPGGGFIGGLAGGIAFIMTSLSYQQGKIPTKLKRGIFQLCTVGLALILASCSLPMLAGYPFLTHLDGVGIIDTAFLFEVGIFMIVLGMSVSAVFSMRGRILTEGSA